MYYFLFVKKLKFYQWSLNFFNNVCNFNVQKLRSINSSKLSAKLGSTFFYHVVNANISDKLLHGYAAFPLFCYFSRFPNLNWNPHNEFFYFFNDNRLNDQNRTSESLIYTSLYYSFAMWFWFPECISELKKYYPVMNIPFSDLEFQYIDFWIEILPIFEDCLGHLLVNETPLVEPRVTAQMLYVSKNGIVLQPPIKEDIDFSKHLEDYYFGEGSHPFFLEVITAYLENRPGLKNKCRISWENDKASNLNVSSNLSIYFICNYLIKNISKSTLRFVVANTPIAEIRPIKKLQIERMNYWNNMSLEDQKFAMSKKRDFLIEALAEKNKSLYKM